MHVLRRSREIVSEILTEQEKTNYQILSQLDEVIEGIAQRLEEEAKLARQKNRPPNEPVTISNVKAWSKPSRGTPSF